MLRRGVAIAAVATATFVPGWAHAAGTERVRIDSAGVEASLGVSFIRPAMLASIHRLLSRPPETTATRSLLATTNALVRGLDC